jgi:hypothetical protein
MRRYFWCLGPFLALLVFLAGGCSRESALARGIVGRWRVGENQGIGVPNSFFWNQMDWIEFREDGTALALIQWPPDGGSEVRLNGKTRYRTIGKSQIEFVGSCRHADPCTGVYTATLRHSALEIRDAEGELTLRRVGPTARELPPTVVGPSPSPTPAATK